MLTSLPRHVLGRAIELRASSDWWNDDDSLRTWAPIIHCFKVLLPLALVHSGSIRAAKLRGPPSYISSRENYGFTKLTGLPIRHGSPLEILGRKVRHAQGSRPQPATGPQKVKPTIPALSSLTEFASRKTALCLTWPGPSRDSPQWWILCPAAWPLGAVRRSLQAIEAVLNVLSLFHHYGLFFFCFRGWILRLDLGKCIQSFLAASINHDLT